MSSLHYPKFVEETILELSHSYRVVEVQAPPYVVNPLSVSVQPNGKKRLILDLRYVNKHLIKQRVKYEDSRIALSYFQKGAFMISFDLKSGYHDIDICPDHQTFLGFAWKFSGDTKFNIFHEQVKRHRLTFFSYHLFKTCSSCPVTQENVTFILMLLYLHNRLSVFMIIAQMNLLFCMNACQ